MIQLVYWQNMYIIVNIIAMLCILYADDNNNKEPADKCKLMRLMTNSLFPDFGILLYIIKNYFHSFV